MVVLAVLHPTWLQPFQGSLGQHLQAKMNPAPRQTSPQFDDLQSRVGKETFVVVLLNQYSICERLLSFIVLHLRTACLIQQKLVQLQLAQTSTLLYSWIVGRTWARRSRSAALHCTIAS